MNIRLFRSSSAQPGSFHRNYTWDTGFLPDVNIMERYVTTTYRLHELQCK